MSIPNQTYTSRWAEGSAYSENWKDRSAALWQMFNARERIRGKKYSISEFGCGKYAPFEKCVGPDTGIGLQKYDIHQWDEGTIECDLNSDKTSILPADVAVFAGVLEYLNDVEGTLKNIFDSHSFILFSYVFVPLNECESDEGYMNCISGRCLNHGWRNHYSNRQIVDLLQSIGTISGVGSWGGNQSMFLVRRYGD